ncbi:MAG: DEAD/DEAH box helicase [Methanobrevibacter sp.]|nr:DEAD/DEAH box helicase [Bacteroidales bacterium]MBO7209683.1 DEAD/DEAH box helicase [Methanobrevibacter sp.]
MLVEKVYNLNSFQRQYEALLTLSVCDTIPNLIWNKDKSTLLSLIDWDNMLSIASLFCYSEENKYVDAALRIAQTCILQESCTENQKNASAFILDTLTNKPAIKLAITKKYLKESYKEHLPFSLKLQQCKSDYEHTIIINEDIITLNRFQKEVYAAHKSNETISISAPTSAGKSYILCTLILEELSKGNKNIVYVVPTRALISQVEADLRALLKQYNLEAQTNITTVPPQDVINTEISNVYVFTQERLHWFLFGNNSTNIDLLIVDEAHKIEDGNRGILLQQKIEDVVKANPNVKVYFSSPFTSNPEILLDNVINNSRKCKVNTQFVSVNQNLLHISQVPRKIKEWLIHLCTIEKTILLGKIVMTDRPTSELHKIVHTAYQTSNKGGCLIYSNGAAEAEKTAILLSNLLTDIKNTPEIIDLIKLVKKTIHKDYVLATVLRKGIAFHYGNMPLLIREEIERLFSIGKIDYLVCTSTLLEGVNLPAKSIIIRKPTRGKGKPLNQNDFWNLAGRAGRWGKEYSGNIFCIAPSDWDVQPEPNKTKQEIKRAINTIENNGDELLEYIQNESPRKVAESRQDLESALGYFYIKHIIDKEEFPSDSFYVKLMQKLKNINTKITLPSSILKKNPGISPLAQQTLFNYFNSHINTIEELIPVYPNDSNAFDEYTKLVGIIGQTISCYPDELNAARAILLINWMSGKPLSYLIDKSFKSYQKNGYNKPLPVVIREVMENVENFVRFKFAKDSCCYVDILRYVLELNGKQDLIDNIPQLSLWLEFGVSQKTHLSLLALGLSRNTVLELAQLTVSTEKSIEECLTWLRSLNLEELDLSPIIINDIKKVL